ncbi:serine/threonine-protein kinase-like protein ACR4 [Lolium rigidum]|uniref:serine/threonine-protein kinase-like protein ACR4 n=1 Tax=Lolium rigidum TaxID=89674 RepID=UPI001F5D8F80|nr:serine/threonine-protein kinase-like protein ACR4 [Lolium rigidum]XP_051227932.1 serine/threonine-protein kinase-like protein ACR4 [Lolium perenne]XP_051227934.1 serine/threonine-protein kinase-like protein ACR4 [Lolium perenne]XP_051227935.1 serine/threonine-protein kinase-like protein ACR4 [Lolium perenne]
MSSILAISLGGAAGGVALLGAVTVLVVLCLRHRRRTSDSSESNSSGPSHPDMQGARCMPLEELKSATNNFSSSNLIGNGMFGEVFNGLLQDGTIIAVKRRHSPPSQEFIQEVNYLSSIRHRNLVKLLGYCQDNGMQMLVYEYVPNGSVSTHLHGNGHAPTVRLEFKQRLSIAHGTAKGLSHLHSLTPPAVHMNFKTVNVLVDEDFTPKVADAGIRGLLDRLGSADPSSRICNDPFLDPRGREAMIFSIQSDVYSFGVFLVELISGRRAVADKSIIEWVQNFLESSDISAIADSRMASGFTSESMKELLRLASWCLNQMGEHRPSMSLVEAEIHRIREQEIRLTTIMPEATTTVTLGSQLFTASR